MTASTIVVTVPGMIEDQDLAPLRQVSDVVYHEVDHVSSDELARLVDGHAYLMLNYDVVKTLDSGFYEQPAVRELVAISADITGMDWASPEAAVANEVKLTNIPHYSTESVAETILAETLLHSRQRHSAYEDAQAGRKPEARQGFNLSGRRAGVVGLGSIGLRTAELYAGVGMEVVGWNRSDRPGQAVVGLPELFSTSKVISISLKTVRDGDEANVGMIGRELLSLCEQAVIVNLANVDLVDHDAMADAIEAGRVIGYTVEYKDSLAASRLGSLPAVHMPPSNSWLSEESLAALRHVWVRNILDAVDGKFPNLVSAR